MRFSELRLLLPWVAFPLALALLATAAPAQTSAKFVSNTGQTATTTLLNVIYAQAFTTGSNPNGYVLTRVDWKFKRDGTTPITLANINGWISEESSGTPHNAVTNLVDPASLPSDGLAQFTVPGGGIELAPNRTYFAGLNVSASSTDQLHETTSDGEDTGAATGWSIADSYRTRSRDSTDWTGSTTDNDSLMIALHGYVAPPRLVSNLQQVEVPGTSAFTTDFAQAFTTGSNASGYRLTRVDVQANSIATSPPVYSVSIRSDSAGSPGASVGTLTNPASLPAGNGIVTYSAPEGGIALRANTTYFVLVDVSSGNLNTSFTRTASDAQDSTSESDWSIADTSLWRFNYTTGGWTTDSNSTRISV
ncbi:MAG: hypothetical protein F4156_03220, partial [Holophagales bacterium]|nr:hypothetical protein [Holophagales bacterium]